MIDDADPFDQCTDHDMFVIRAKSRYLAIELSCFLEHYTTVPTIQEYSKWD